MRGLHSPVARAPHRSSPQLKHACMQIICPCRGPAATAGLHPAESHACWYHLTILAKICPAPYSSPDLAEDPLLPLGYTAESVVEGKAAAKAELRKRMQLSNAGVCSYCSGFVVHCCCTVLCT